MLGKMALAAGAQLGKSSTVPTRMSSTENVVVNMAVTIAHQKSWGDFNRVTGINATASRQVIMQAPTLCAGFSEAQSSLMILAPNSK